MEKEVEKYYEDYFELFHTDGWKTFIGTLTKERDALRENWSTIERSKVFFNVKGRLTILEQIVSLESTVRQGYEAVLNQDNEED